MTLFIKAESKQLKVLADPKVGKHDKTWSYLNIIKKKKGKTDMHIYIFLKASQ